MEKNTVCAIFWSLHHFRTQRQVVQLRPMFSPNVVWMVAFSVFGVPEREIVYSNCVVARYD